MHKEKETNHTDSTLFGYINIFFWSSSSPKSSPPRPNPNPNPKEVPNSKVELGLGVTLKSHS